jgi:hypothetical protein
LHAERLADVVDDVLIGRRLSPPGASSPVKNASTESTSGSPPVTSSIPRRSRNCSAISARPVRAADP